MSDVPCDGGSEGRRSADPSAARSSPALDGAARGGAHRFDARTELRVALGGVFLLFWMVGTALAAAWSVRQVRELVAVELRGPGRTEPARSPADAAPSSAEPPSDPRTEAPPKLPEATRTSVTGDLEVVQLGRTAGTLAQTLREEVLRAAALGQVAVVLVTEDGECPPCRGVDATLEDPVFRAALGRVRLIRVARTPFREELKTLHLQAELVPMFLRFAADLALLDAIHGGEWDEDVAANIAPVLAAFVRGRYRVRRHPGWTPMLDSLRL